jgi:hypothetical protein
VSHGKLAQAGSTSLIPMSLTSSLFPQCHPQILLHGQQTAAPQTPISDQGLAAAIHPQHPANPQTQHPRSLPPLTCRLLITPPTHCNGVPSPNNPFFPLLPTQSEISKDQGIKTFDYYLERNRIAGAPSGERNFHIFYYLFAGPAVEVRQHMQLLEKTMCWYLSHGSLQYPRWLSEHGFSKRHVAQTCQLIAAILHLGNLEFTID